MNIHCRLFGLPKTTQDMTVNTADELASVAERYCKDHCRCAENDVYFVQLWATDAPDPTNFELWRCHVVNQSEVLIILSTEATEADMQREISQTATAEAEMG